MKLYQKIASTITAINNCRQSGNVEWLEKHKDALYSIEKNVLPHGSGIDAGCTINLEISNETRIIIDCPFHTMDEHGYYSGWRDYQIIIKAHLAFGFTVTVKGRDYNELKDYLSDTFHHVMSEEI